MAKGLDRKSMKKSGMHKGPGIDSKTHLGKLMQKHRDVDEVLYSYTTNVDMVFDDMDFTVEEFADITGAAVTDLVEDLAKACK